MSRDDEWDAFVKLVNEADKLRESFDTTQESTITMEKQS